MGITTGKTVGKSTPAGPVDRDGGGKNAIGEKGSVEKHGAIDGGVKTVGLKDLWVLKTLSWGRLV